MRTTLTIDDDVAKLLEKEVRRTGEPFKVTVNQLLRRGLASSQQPQSKPFKVTPWKIGLPPGLSYDNIHELLEAIEGPDYR